MTVLFTIRQEVIFNFTDHVNDTCRQHLTRHNPCFTVHLSNCSLIMMLLINFLPKHWYRKHLSEVKTAKVSNSIMHVQFVAGQLCKIINLSHAMPTKLPGSESLSSRKWWLFSLLDNNFPPLGSKHTDISYLLPLGPAATLPSALQLCCKSVRFSPVVCLPFYCSFLRPELSRSRRPRAYTRGA